MRFSIRTMHCLSAIVAMLLFAAHHCLGPVIPNSTAHRIAIGTARSEVRAILGAPVPSSTEKVWTYERLMNPGWFVVYFDDAKNVEYLDHETALGMRN